MRIGSDHEALTVEEGRERIRAGHLAPRPRGLHGAQPPGAPAPGRRARLAPHRVLHRRPRPGGHRRPRSRQRHGARSGRGRRAARRMRCRWRRQRGAVPRPHPSRRDRARATRPTSSSFPTSSTSCPTLVLKRGRRSATSRAPACPSGCASRCRIAPVTARRLRDPVGGRPGAGDRARPEQVVTESLVARAARRRRARGERRGARPRQDRRRRAPSRDRAGRARASSRAPGCAAARSPRRVAHDAHNIVVLGVTDAEMAFAATRLAEIGGGIVAVEGDRVLAECPLPVAGLMSDAPLADVVEPRAGRATRPRPGSAGSARRRS